MSQVNSSNCQGSIKPCNIEHGDPLSSWPIWVSILCGFLLLSIIMGIHHRWKKTRPSTQSRRNPPPSASSEHRVITVQPLPGTGENLFYSNLDQYFTTKSIDEKQVLSHQLFSSHTPQTQTLGVRPPPYSELPRRSADAEDPLNSKSLAENQDEDLKKALSVIQPMQPAYRTPSISPSANHSQIRGVSVVHM